MLNQLAMFRRLVTLRDGTHLLLRPLQPADEAQLVAFFAHTPPEDLRYLYDDVTDAELVASWTRNIDLRRVFPLVGLINDRIVGEATLHMGKGPKRHLAWVRIYLAPEWRGHGVGSHMLKGLIEIARKIGLHQVIAEIVASQVRVIKAFERLGFVHRFSFPDHFMTMEGVTYDVAVMILRLTEEWDEF